MPPRLTQLAPRFGRPRAGHLLVACGLFIGLGLYTLIQYIPLLLNQLISQFRDKVGEGALNLTKPPERDYLILYLIRVTAGAVLIYAAPALTNYIEKVLSTRLQSESKTP